MATHHARFGRHETFKATRRARLRAAARAFVLRHSAALDQEIDMRMSLATRLLATGQNLRADETATAATFALAYAAQRVTR